MNQIQANSGYLDFAVGLARRAGQIMATNFTLGMAKTWKDDNTPLTVTDVAINEMVLKAVAETYPGHGVVGEEDSSTDDLQRGWVWVCDPVDGTVPFSHGAPCFAFSLALLHDGEVQCAVAYDAMSDRMYTAERDSGTFCNGRRMRVQDELHVETPVVDLEDPSMSTSFAWGSIREELKAKGMLVQTFWSVVFSATRVASGDMSATICNAGHVWDIAAISLLVKEAGGTVTDIEGNPVRMIEPQHGFVLSNGLVHDGLIETFAANRR